MAILLKIKLSREVTQEELNELKSAILSQIETLEIVSKIEWIVTNSLGETIERQDSFIL